MGNWRTVNITGTMSAADAATLRNLLDWGDYANGRRDVLHYAECLSFSTVSPGLAGLGAWPAEKMNRCGNLHERDYSVQDVEDALKVLVQHAPSMLLVVHCGDDWESETCVATIRVGEGLVVPGKPEREKVDKPSTEQMYANLMANMLR